MPCTPQWHLPLLPQVPVVQGVGLYFDSSIVFSRPNKTSHWLILHRHRKILLLLFLSAAHIRDLATAEHVFPFHPVSCIVLCHSHDPCILPKARNLYMQYVACCMQQNLYISYLNSSTLTTSAPCNCTVSLSPFSFTHMYCFCSYQLSCPFFL